MAKKVSTKKIIKKDPADSSKPEEIFLDTNIQYVKVYPKYNPLRK
tara:strand:+ start:210 stop:344 length:135 start_codon:yes stop_codon:yes gene_type:complete